MNRATFIKFLEDNGCALVREDKSGYSVYRNVINGVISGIPVNDPLKAATVCRILKTLCIDDLPENEDLTNAKAIVDSVHRN